jgi:hypothetical protein
MTNSENRQVMADYRALAEWVKDTCLLFGTTVETAYRVAAMFVEGLKHNLENTHASV